MTQEAGKVLKNEELEVEEVNVYSSGCGDIKIHCMHDCEFTFDSWLSTDH